VAPQKVEVEAGIIIIIAITVIHIESARQNAYGGDRRLIELFGRFGAANRRKF